MPRSLPLRRDYELLRTSEFAYECRSCSKCCRGKLIPVNPYEVARLAEQLRTSTTFVIERFTTDGAWLTHAADDDACVFLGPRGCEVHPARPLACRMYPLGHRHSANGDERFAEIEPHPETAGVYGGPGTLADYLRAQGAEEYIAMSKRYLELLRKMVRVLRERGVDAADDEGDGSPANLLDVDSVVAAFCAERGLPFPADVTERVRTHIAAIEALVADLTERP